MRWPWPWPAARGSRCPWSRGRASGRPARTGRRRRHRDPPAPGLVVVAVPPAVTAAVVADALRRFPGAVVTDVASVKVPIHRALVAAGVDASRYVGGHPMAGREVSGPAAARADLIDDRPWVITPHPGADEAAVDAVQELALAARALPIVMPAAEHDRAVAVVSHTPQILSSLLAARLLDSSDTVVSIAGQGLRDMTRIAASDADLWVEILSANATPVAAVLGALRADLDSLLHALGSIDQGGQDVLARGPAPGQRRAAIACRASTVPDRRRQPSCRSQCPTSQASSAGCSPPSPRRGTPSRTSGSSTCSVGPRAWWRSRSVRCRPCPSPRRWVPRAGTCGPDPTRTRSCLTSNGWSRSVLRPGGPVGHSPATEPRRVRGSQPTGREWT